MDPRTVVATAYDSALGSYANLERPAAPWLSPEQIVRTRSNVPQGTFAAGDAAQAEFDPGRFDAVVSLYTLDDIPRAEHEGLLERIFRWLETGRWAAAQRVWILGRKPPLPQQSCRSGVWCPTFARTTSTRAAGSTASWGLRRRWTSAEW